MNVKSNVQWIQAGKVSKNTKKNIHENADIYILIQRNEHNFLAQQTLIAEFRILMKIYLKSLSAVSQGLPFHCE